MIPWSHWEGKWRDTKNDHKTICPLDRTDVFRPTPLEVLDVQLLDIFGQGQLPGFLFRVGQAADLLRIQLQLSGHLKVGMRKMVVRPRIDPLLAFVRYLFLCQQTSTFRFSVL